MIESTGADQNDSTRSAEPGEHTDHAFEPDDVGGEIAISASGGDDQPDGPQGMIPGRRRRRTEVERVAMRVLATGGIIGIAVALGAILVSKHVSGWIVGLTIGITSVSLAAVLWSSRQLQPGLSEPGDFVLEAGGSGVATLDAGFDSTS